MPHKDPADHQAYLARTKKHRLQVHRAWVVAHPDKRHASSAAARERNRKSIRQADRARYHANPERFRKKKREKYAKNAEIVCTTHRNQRKDDPERIRTQDRARRLKDPEKARRQDHVRRLRTGKHIDELARARRAANPEPFRMRDRARSHTSVRKIQAVTAKRQRRAAKANAEKNDLTHVQWLEIQASQAHRCYYCHKRCKGHLTQDHITPLSQGGSHTLHNVIAACRNCNSQKGARKPPIPVQPLLLTIAAARKKKAS
jgi:5-methylcytosine-specific restriction endonuclease McrA